MSISRECARREDMSQRGELQLIQQDDGDIIVSCLGVDICGRLYKESHVEFCTPVSGGGRSPKVREALLALMDAIDQDNKDNPISSSCATDEDSDKPDENGYTRADEDWFFDDKDD